MLHPKPYAYNRVVYYNTSIQHIVITYIILYIIIIIDGYYYYQCRAARAGKVTTSEDPRSLLRTVLYMCVCVCTHAGIGLFERKKMT
jgi:hypothetical protein